LRHAEPAATAPVVVVDERSDAWFASDLHLDDDRPALTRRFVAALAELPGPGPRAGERGPALFLLGDLFEFWIGDDYRNQAALALAEALRRLAARDWRVFLLRGNRDFLIGPTFAADCAARLLDEPVLVEVAGERLVLTHGDAECLDDHRYQQWRALSHSPDWQRDFLARPIAERLQLARAARAASLANRTPDGGRAEDGIDTRVEGGGDLSPAAVAGLLERFQAVGLVHGHTHRPARHDLPAGRWRWVLSDWETEPPRGRIAALAEFAPGD
jgi:UDP-2,3-diacylglucosamine hydrolase